ncbi:hypothetical protein Myrod_0839 [Myroides odoratus DSM 2801]|nr:hypothetical protein Myrod_0839 [Myroides odoratus DSM 2801]
MNIKMKILIVESNLMVVEGYISILGKKKHTFLNTTNCEDFFTLFETILDLDLAIITYDLVGVSENKLVSVSDCVLVIKRNIPYCKIILLSESEKALALYTMYKTIETDALIVQSDFTKELLLDLVESNKYTLPYLSPLAEGAIQTIIKNNTLLDSKNRRIIALLSQGYRIYQLSDEILLSRSAIQKRVSKMMVAFNVKDYQELLAVLRVCKII